MGANEMFERICHQNANLCRISVPPLQYACFVVEIAYRALKRCDISALGLASIRINFVRMPIFVASG